MEREKGDSLYMPTSIFLDINKQHFPFVQRTFEPKLERHRSIHTSNLQAVDIKWHESLDFQVSSHCLHVRPHLSFILNIWVNL